MNKTIYAAPAVMIALALAGCSAATPTAETVKTAASSSPSATPEASALPVLTAAPPAPVEEEFLTATHRIPGLEKVSMKDALAVGHYVCSQLDAGVSPLDITAVTNTEKINNEDMIMVSTLTLCTGHNDAVQAIFSAEHTAEAKKN